MCKKTKVANILNIKYKKFFKGRSFMVKKLLPSLSMFALYVVFILGSTTLADVFQTEDYQVKGSNGAMENKVVSLEMTEYDETDKYEEFNLEVLDSNVRVFCFSSSKTDSVEIVELYPIPSGKYAVRIKDAKAINYAEK